jgi:sporulation protein YlmC with PRC-barrel domain
MRSFLFIVTGTTALASSLALAQAPTIGTPTTGAASTTATLADCDRLETFLEQRGSTNPGVTVEQVRTYRTSKNAQACHDALVRLDPSSQANNQEGKEGGATNIVVQQPAPALRVEQGAPKVTIQQQQPQVTVRQPQPDITVRQPAPTVTIDIPQPEIVVRMPKPEVNVAMAQPQVQVNQPPPQVQVTQPPQQPQVEVQPAQPQVSVQQSAPNVQVQENNTQPSVHYERAEPKVVINQPQGQPQVRFEEVDSNQQGRPQQNTASDTDRRQPATSGKAIPGSSATSTAGQQITASRIKNMAVYDVKGTKVGDVARIVQAQDGKRELIVGVGGFLGLGERYVTIPADNIAVRGDRLQLEGLTEDQLKRMPPTDRNSRDLRDVDGNATIELSSR